MRRRPRAAPRTSSRSDGLHGFPCGTRGRASAQLRQLRFCLLQPETHVHLAVHRRRGGEVLVGLFPLAPVPIELAEAEVAVGDEGAHAESTREADGFTKVFSRVHVTRALALWGQSPEEAQSRGFLAAFFVPAG